VDCGVQLIALATQRLPQYASHFWIANAWEWIPPRQFRYVYSLYDCVPVELLPEYIRRLLTRYVEPGGTLIIGAYGSYSKQEAARDIAQDLAAAGFRVAGSSSRGELPVSRVAWIQAEQGHEPTRRSARLMPSVCAVHAVMLGGASPPSRYSWSRRTREAQGRHREVGSEGSVERTCGARDTNPIRGVVPSGRAGTQPSSPPSTGGCAL
jgi:hypothetical protein